MENGDEIDVVVEQVGGQNWVYNVKTNPNKGKRHWSNDLLYAYVTWHLFIKIIKFPSLKCFSLESLIIISNNNKRVKFINLGLFNLAKI